MKPYTWQLIARDADDQSLKLMSPSDVAAWVVTRPEFKSIRETFMVVVVNTRNELVGFETISIGTHNGTLVHPREVFRTALHIPECVAIITVHNHPSGDPAPSQDDIEITERVKQGGRLLGIELLDHIIVTPDGKTASMGERGQIA